MHFVQSFGSIQGRQDDNESKGLGFVCDFFEKQFTTITAGAVKVCCGDDYGIVSNCRTDRCLASPEDDSTSRVCCSTQGNLNACAGPATSNGRTNIEPTCAGGAVTNIIDTTSGTARVCCINSQSCGRAVSCSKITRNTTPNGAFYYCCSGTNGISYCDQARTPRLQGASIAIGGTPPPRGAQPVQPFQPNPTRPIVPIILPTTQPILPPAICLYSRMNLSVSFAETLNEIESTADALLKTGRGHESELEEILARIPNQIALGITGGESKLLEL